MRGVQCLAEDISPRHDQLQRAVDYCFAKFKTEEESIETPVVDDRMADLGADQQRIRDSLAG